MPTQTAHILIAHSITEVEQQLLQPLQLLVGARPSYVFRDLQGHASDLQNVGTSTARKGHVFCGRRFNHKKQC